MNQLEQLKQFTTVVADTGDFHLLRQYQPRDATTNPSLILKTAQKADYATLVERIVGEAAGQSTETIVDRLLVAFGQEILQAIPGRVSTEVDARLSFDTAATVTKARQLIALYEQAGIDRGRVLIKIAATWEGIAAARLLERDGIHCNMTLIFSHAQAIACGEAGVRLISPFVGRITDWYKKRDGVSAFSAADDPGVASVRAIYADFKSRDIPTEIMAASFRSTEQILALAGCDLLTISPDLLEQLKQSDAPITAQLTANQRAASNPSTRQPFSEASFRWALNEDPMTTEKLAEGIRTFAADAIALERLIEPLKTRLARSV